ncbi:hypothetical protein M5D96_009291 [Drosophila gunungcola]|uniref:Uncharacterized protein n=1 Tax=Drosophila gunungcola TaxID=103775 RepID=A0A9Q0BN81_9MUSC|nr:hypothetical protein M5D96_009291 [Drosophila gunungcola]
MNENIPCQSHADTLHRGIISKRGYQNSEPHETGSLIKVPMPLNSWSRRVPEIGDRSRHSQCETRSAALHIA